MTPSNSAVPVNQWALVTLSYDATKHIEDFYINGSLVRTVNVGAGSPTTNTNTLLIGKRRDGVYFKGSLDDVRVYNRMLSAAEVGTLYTSLD